MGKTFCRTKCWGSFDVRPSRIKNIKYITSESGDWDANLPHASVFAFIYRTLVVTWVRVLCIILLLHCKWYKTTRSATLMSSMIMTASNAERSTDEWSQKFFDGDLNTWSQSDDVFRGFLRLRKLLPLKCNGSEQLKLRRDVSKYTWLINWYYIMRVVECKNS
jgi:hypothetical protein